VLLENGFGSLLPPLAGLVVTDATVRDEVLGRENVGEETDGGGEIDGTDGDELAGGGGRPAEGGGGLEVGGGGGLLPPPPPPPPPPLLAQHAESPAGQQNSFPGHFTFPTPLQPPMESQILPIAQHPGIPSTVVQ
jgi:hypothetical protein